MKQLVFFLVFWGSLTLLSCESSGDEAVPEDLSHFLPLKIGYYQLYDVEETTYELGVESFKHYQLKTIVTDSFPNEEGSYTYVIHRSTRNASSDDWITKETWSARIAGQEAIVTEGSTPFVVLRLPLFIGQTWDGNFYNNTNNPGTNLNEDLYSVKEKNKTLSLNEETYSECVTIEQENNEEFIVFHDVRREVYAKNIGLVQKEVIQLQYCNDEDRGCVGKQIVDEGIIFKQTLLEYGIE